jgi:hypothetical protein
MTGWGGRRWGKETVAESYPVNPVHPVCGEEEDRINGMGSRRALLRRLIGTIVRLRLRVRIDSKVLS